MPKKVGLKTCVEAFLELVISPPEKEPKQQYLQRENAAEIRGYNKAQEQLRGILELNGTEGAVKLAEIRAEGQIRPIRIGDQSVWMG